jgi:hypothetical protein
MLPAGYAEGHVAHSRRISGAYPARRWNGPKTVLQGDSTMQAESVKEQAHRLLGNLSDSATWEDLIYRIYVRQAIEAGIKDSDEGKTVDVGEVRKRFGLPA